jgi:hypothetical protein
MTTTRYGWEGFLYRNTGTHDAPVWTEISGIGNVKAPSLKFADNRLKIRSGGHALHEPGEMDLEVSFDFIHDPADVNWIALYAAAAGRAAVEVAVTDRAITDGDVEGWRMPAKVLEFSEDEPDGDVDMDHVVLKECQAEHQASRL